MKPDTTINNTESLKNQALVLGNAIAYHMMNKPTGINHRGHDCIEIPFSYTCQNDDCRTCPIKAVEHAKSIERQNANQTRGY
jgi:predicted metalloenzyme YecM